MLMITPKDVPTNVNWTLPFNERLYLQWNVGVHACYHGTSSVFLEDILRDGFLRADFDKCGRGEQGVFFNVDYRYPNRRVYSGFEHALGRAQFKVAHLGGYPIVFTGQISLIQTSSLEPWIALSREYVSLTEISDAYVRHRELREDINDLLRFRRQAIASARNYRLPKSSFSYFC